MENGGGWQAAGPATFLGSEGRLRFRTPDGRAFERTIQGVLGERILYDGERGWMWDCNGASRRLELFDLESPVLSTSVLTGAWRAHEAPVAFRHAGSGADVVEAGTLRALRLGRLDAHLVVDQGSGLPTSLRYRSASGPVTWSFDDHRAIEGWPVPLHVTQSLGDDEILRFDLVDVGPYAGESGFDEPHGHPRDFDLDLEAPSRLEVRRGPHGHLLVRVRVGDGDPEWWILDSGASGSTIAPASAARAGLPAIGTIIVRSVLGPTRSSVHAASSLSVGPLVLHDLRLAGFDLAPFGDVFGVEIGGVLGFDLFRRATVAVEPTTDDVRLFPIGWTGPSDLDVRRERLVLHLGHPVIEGRLEGRAARFRLDLGMGGNGVIVHAPTTSGWRLLGGRATEPTAIGAAEARSGQVASLEFAGREWTDVATVFAVGGDGPFDDPHVEATIGVGLLDGLRVLLDYAGGRITFSEVG